jgi:hypothetical protein
MTREELLALRDAIDEVLVWPDSVRDQIVQWLSPETAKPNGRDHHPPARENGPAAGQFLKAAAAPTPRPTRARPGKPPSGKAAEQRLIAAMQEHSGASVNVLAKAAGESLEHRRAPARARLARGGHEGQRRSLAACGGPCGRGGGPYAAAVALTAGSEAEPLEEVCVLVSSEGTIKPAHAYALWIRPLAEYERRERHEFAMARYG